jgi:hypothetical protein
MISGDRIIDNNLSTKLIPGLDNISDEFYQKFKGELIPSFLKLPKIIKEGDTYKLIL